MLQYMYMYMHTFMILLHTFWSAIYAWCKMAFFHVAFVLGRLYELGARFQHWSKEVFDNYTVDSRQEAFVWVKLDARDNDNGCHRPDFDQILPRQGSLSIVYSVVIKYLPCSVGIYF